MSSGFSVVIPAYNYGHCIERAVQSVLSQSYPDFEVLVIDDGSTDRTAEVMRRLLSQCPPRLRYIRQENQGVSAARNRGISETTFPWLVFLDADDELCPDAMQALQTCAYENPESRLLIGGHYSCVGEHCLAVAPEHVSGDRKKNLAAYLDKRLSLSNGACAMHRQVFKSIQYDVGLRHTEDIPVFAKVLANFSAVATPAVLAKIHKHPDSRRHDINAALEVGMALECAIFGDPVMPLWALPLRKSYHVRRLLSLLKMCDRAGRCHEVRLFYRMLLRASPFVALQPRYVRRFIMSLLRK